MPSQWQPARPWSPEKPFSLPFVSEVLGVDLAAMRSAIVARIEGGENGALPRLLR